MRCPNCDYEVAGFNQHQIDEAFARLDIARAKADDARRSDKRRDDRSISGLFFGFLSFFIVGAFGGNWSACFAAGMIGFIVGAGLMIYLQDIEIHRAKTGEDKCR